MSRRRKLVVGAVLAAPLVAFTVAVARPYPVEKLAPAGATSLVITDRDEPGAIELATTIAQHFWQRRFAMEPKVYEPAEAIRLGAA